MKCICDILVKLTQCRLTITIEHVALFFRATMNSRKKETGNAINREEVDRGLPLTTIAKDF